ncbi:ABC transporter ATP-binding protein [Goodfellowiella coeruleoviolacea]|uniref:ABC-2 type transport system ATP-binding protein n=1 Tax=Goodfellowiella coeruleoviolacea TaxID=334858 RepID=A0AAE3GEX4_9PSEU|nr:ATP-binding cassette domain-containing protein [Goodfellowiella coeruleoviolacea]MCP2166997.1 ABC-2 type transport system ATP-binding protein [Goodfellowiella coeruleoviolacea]
MEVALEAEQLGKRYRNTWALRDCSLRLPADRVAALVGPNGAGRTTLLHLAAGLLRPDAGQVRVFGRPPHNNTEVLTDIGFVAQDTPLYPEFTAAELVIMGAKLNPRRWDDALARTRLADQGIPPDRPVSQLSGGQRAQVALALALALARQPRLLLLGEPVASLDPMARHEFLRTLMDGVAESGTTVLLSSHVLADLERTCDHVIVLNTARVQLTGSADELAAGHRLLVGPRHGGGPIPGVAEIVRSSHTDRQSGTAGAAVVDRRFSSPGPRTCRPRVPRPAGRARRGCPRARTAR